MPKSWFPFHWSHTSPGLPAALSACDRMTCVIYQRGQAGPWERLPTKPERVHFAVPSYPLWAPCQERLWCFCLHSITVSPSTFTALTLHLSVQQPFRVQLERLGDPRGCVVQPGTPPHRCVGAPPQSVVSPFSPYFLMTFNNSSLKFSQVWQGQKQEESPLY